MKDESGNELIIVLVIRHSSFVIRHLARGPTHVPAAEEMKVQMKNGLPRIRANVRHHAIAAD